MTTKAKDAMVITSTLEMKITIMTTKAKDAMVTTSTLEMKITTSNIIPLLHGTMTIYAPTTNKDWCDPLVDGF